MDNRIYGRKENIGKIWNKNEKYILVVFRSQWKIRTFFINESEQKNASASSDRNVSVYC